MQGRLVLFGPTNDDYSNELVLADLNAPVPVGRKGAAPAPVGESGRELPLWQPGYALRPLLPEAAAGPGHLLGSLRAVQISPRHRFLAAIETNSQAHAEERLLSDGHNLELLMLMDLGTGGLRRFHFPDWNYARLQGLDFAADEQTLVTGLAGQPQLGGDFSPIERHGLMLLNLVDGSLRRLFESASELLEPHFTRYQGRQMLLCRSALPFGPRSADSWLFVDPEDGASREFDLFDYREPMVHTLRMSPDGRAVAYVCLCDTQIRLMLYDIGSGRHEILTEFPLLEISLMPDELTWSPDGRALAFQLYQPPLEPNRIVSLNLPALGENASEEDYQRLRQLLLDPAPEPERATVLGYTRKPVMDLRGIWVIDRASRHARRVVCCDEHFILSWSQEEGRID